MHGGHLLTLRFQGTVTICHTLLVPVTMYHFSRIYFCSLCRMALVTQFPARRLCLWLRRFLYIHCISISLCPVLYIVRSRDPKQALLASQTGDADASQILHRWSPLVFTGSWQIYVVLCYWCHSECAFTLVFFVHFCHSTHSQTLAVWVGSADPREGGGVLVYARSW